jgi:hypothetical protein
MVIRPGIGYLADLNITYPFRWDLIAMGVSLLVAAVVKKDAIGRSEDQKP